MKISNSKKQLAKIILENGGWLGGVFSVQNGEHGRISFSENKPSRHGRKSWTAEGGFQFKIEVCKPAKNWHQTILSRDEYLHLYPAPVKVVVENKTTCHLTVTDKPTIEQLAADYRNRKDYAARKQQEADAAKADAEAKLAELVAAGKALGLVLSVTGVGFESEFQIRCFRNEKLGLNPKYSNAVRMERCEVCGHRFGLHHGDDNRCPAEGDDDV